MTRTNVYLAVYGFILIALLLAPQLANVDSALTIPNCLKKIDPATLESQCLSTPGDTILELLKDLMKIISTLDMAILGTGAALVVKGHEWSDQWETTDGVIIVVVFSSTASSLYGVYLTYVAILSMASKGVISPDEKRIEIAMSIGYYGLLTAVILLGVVFIRMLAGRKTVPPV